MKHETNLPQGKPAHSPIVSGAEPAGGSRMEANAAFVAAQMDRNALENLYAPIDNNGIDDDAIKHQVISRLQEQIHFKMANLPPGASAAENAAVVADAVAAVIVEISSLSAGSVNTHLLIECSLRAVHRVQSPACSSAVCGLLLEFHLGKWLPTLTKPQLYTIQQAIEGALAALPADSLSPLWDLSLDSEDRIRTAVYTGIEMLTHRHKSMHLLFGLETCSSREVQYKIAGSLEQVADPLSVPRLSSIRLKAAHDNWPLARQIARAINTIERQNPGATSQDLMRPAESPPAPDDELLRVTGSNGKTDVGPAGLLHPADPKDR